MHCLRKTSVSTPVFLFLLAAGFMACAPAAADHDDVLAVPTSGSPTPTDIDLPPIGSTVFSAASVSVGKLHTCALVTDGRVACWGSNNYGKLGIGTTSGSQWSPVESVTSLSGITAIGAGEHHTCVVRGANGLVSCWGRNQYGASNPRQPDGSAPTTGCALNAGCGTPSTIPNVSGATSVSGGYDHTCAHAYGGVSGLPDQRGAVCWGRNDTNLLRLEIGNGSPTNNWWPSMTSLDAGEYFTCFRTHYNGVDQQIACFGRWPGSTTIWEDRGIVYVSDPRTAVTVGARHMCMLSSGGAVTCMGESLSGQTGRITTSEAPLVTSPHVAMSSGAVAIAAGARHTCAIVAQGRVKCWGANDYGQLGIGEITSGSNSPVTVDLAASVSAAAISAGGDNTCITTEGGSVYCWGRNDYGQAGVKSVADAVKKPYRVTW
jgi:alpha-tubulin suppressor-like RCC1 family protein